LAYPWPGNVRELSHVIERAVLWSQGGDLTAEHLALTRPSYPVGDTNRIEPSRRSAEPANLEQWERQLLEQALKEEGGNQTRAAQRLGISRDTLRYRIKKHGLG
jgi:DNA-binding NtrC family response regulator